MLSGARCPDPRRALGLALSKTARAPPRALCFPLKAICRLRVTAAQRVRGLIGQTGGIRQNLEPIWNLGRTLALADAATIVRPLISSI